MFVSGTDGSSQRKHKVVVMVWCAGTSIAQGSFFIFYFMNVFLCVMGSSSSFSSPTLCGFGFHLLPLCVQTRAEDAAVGAMCSPLLDFPIDQAAGVIFNIVGGLDMSLTEASLSARAVSLQPCFSIVLLCALCCGIVVNVAIQGWFFMLFGCCFGVRALRWVVSGAINRQTTCFDPS